MIELSTEVRPGAIASNVFDARAEQFRRYLRWAGGANVPGMMGLLVLYLLYGDVYLLLWTAAVILNAFLYWLSYRQTLTIGVERAAPKICYGMWIICLLGVFTDERALIIALLISMLPIIAIAPYVPSRVLLHQCLISVAINGLYAALVAAGISPNNAETLPDEGFYLLINGGIVVCVGIGCLSIWHASRMLNSSINKLSDLNRALRESESALETRVEERTETLRESRQALEQARDAALASSRHKSIFVANMSHELRTPLNAIIGFSDALNQQVFGKLGDRQREYVSDIHDSGRRLLDLINGILDQAKIEAGRYVLHKTTLRLRELVESVCQSLQAAANASSVSLEWESIDPSLQVHADKNALKTVLRNLLDNAIKHSPAGETVKITAESDGHTLDLTVRDSGPGVPESLQQLIFEPFSIQRGRDGTASGAGLGLALVQGMVALHGGEVRIMHPSTPGAAFCVRLPAAIIGGPEVA